LKDILPRVEVVLGFENGGLTYDPDHPEFSNLIIADHLHGYWIYMNEVDTLEVTGAPVDPAATPIYCESGWNLVSYLPNNPDSVAHALTGVIDNLIVALGYKNGGMTYDPTLPEFSTLRVLCPTFGYWLKLTQADTLLYPEPLPELQCPYGSSVGALAKGGGILPTNEWMSIYGTDIKLDGEPLPEGTLVKAVDADGVVCGEFTVTTPGRFGMMPIYRDDPTTEIDEGAEPGDNITIYFNEFEVPIKVTWTSLGDLIDLGEVIASTVGKLTTLPKVYALSQNYPNPFNPETTIKYQLPKASHVSLKIWNILGQEIRTLVDEDKEAGFYTLQWDARDNLDRRVASGVYLYRIEAGDFRMTRKMLILR
jgi:hypothetical protein